MNGFCGTFGALTSFAVAGAPTKLGTSEGPLGGSLGIGAAAIATDAPRSEPTTTTASTGEARPASERTRALRGAVCWIGPSSSAACEASHYLQLDALASAA